MEQVRCGCVSHLGVTLRAHGCSWERPADPTTTPVPDPDPDLMPAGEAGLLSKLVETLRGEAFSSSLRFWLCRVLESFFRGRVCPEDQVCGGGRDTNMQQQTFF